MKTHIDLWALLSPFLLVALPTIALTAVLALCFEMIPLLRGGFGNVVWFFVWNFGLVTPIITQCHWLDPAGLISVLDSLSGQAKRYVPDYRGGMRFQIDVGRHVKIVESWRWPGIAWDSHSILLRLMWLAVACALVLLAALAFDRFDVAKPVRAGKRS